MPQSKLTVYLVSAIIVVLAVGFFVYSQMTKDESVEEFDQALEKAIVKTPEVSPSANPLKQVLPSENPIEKTNPFKNDYQNPFE